MYRLLILIFCLTCSLSLIAQECIKNEHPFDYKAQGNYPPAPLFSPKERATFLPQVPKVNLITGEYCEEACDLIVEGIEPLSIRRFYNHFSGPNERVYGHWRINPEAFMLFNFESIGGCQTFAAAGERNSSFLLYERQIGSDYVLDAAKKKCL